jgi:CHASE3 domain sensor protein
MGRSGDSLLNHLPGGEKAVTASRNPMLVGVVIMTLLLAAFGGVVTFVVLPAVRQTQATDRWTEHTHQVLAGIAAILTNADDAETGQRGFLLTNDAKFLEPYDSGIKNIWVNFLNVQNLTEDNADQQNRLRVLHDLLDNRLSELSRTIEFARTPNIDAAVDLVRGGQGKAFMDDIRRITANMVSEEERLLLSRKTDSANAQRWSEILLLCFGCCSVLIGGIAIVFTSVAGHSRTRSAAIASERQRLLSMLDFAPVMICDMSGAVRFWSGGCRAGNRKIFVSVVANRGTRVLQ